MPRGQFVVLLLKRFLIHGFEGVLGDQIPDSLNQTNCLVL